MSNSDKIQVYGTKDGKLYIKAVDFFSQKKIQSYIRKVSESPTVKALHKSPTIKP